MISRWFSKVLAGCAGLAIGGAAPSQAIQLKSGHVLVGDVEDANTEGLSFRRLDTGGMLELRWEDLALESAERVRRLKGLIVADEAEVTVRADVIIYALPGGVQAEAIGIIGETDDDAIHLMIKGSDLPIRRKMIKKIVRRDVPVYQVYTKDGYYDLLVKQDPPGQDADKHVALADQLRRAGDFDRCIYHLTRAQNLGGGRHTNVIPTMLERATTLKESVDERDALRKIGQLRRKKEFGKAQALVDEFEQTYPDTRLKNELIREKSMLTREREEHMIDRTFQLWERAVWTVARRKAGDLSVSLEQARAYAEEKMKVDVFAQIGKSKELGIEADEVEEYWRNRSKHDKHRHAPMYSYGVGSWVLGEDAITKDTKLGAALAKEEQTAGATSKDDAELQRMIRKLKAQQQAARRRAAKQGIQEETEESWWRDQDANARTTWLRAYFAEFSGVMEIVNAYNYDCGNCYGKGLVTSIGNTGPDQKVKCPVCHGTKYMRSIRAR